MRIIYSISPASVKKLWLFSLRRVIIQDMNRNYQKELDRIIQKRGKTVPRVLLHSCCGPCSSAVLAYLTKYFEVSLLWYNPNIYPREEFDRRFDMYFTRVMALSALLVSIASFILSVVK